MSAEDSQRFGVRETGFTDEERLAFLKALVNGDKTFEIKRTQYTPWDKEHLQKEDTAISIDLNKMREVVNLSKYPELSANIQKALHDEEVKKETEKNTPKPSNATQLANELLGNNDDLAKKLLDAVKKNQNQR